VSLLWRALLDATVLAEGRLPGRAATRERADVVGHHGASHTARRRGGGERWWW
jgi:hypothetical protein